MLHDKKKITKIKSFLRKVTQLLFEMCHKLISNLLKCISGSLKYSYVH